MKTGFGVTMDKATTGQVGMIENIMNFGGMKF
jgi:hypothetical protein